jgi:hypothetical protein
MVKIQSKCIDTCGKASVCAVVIIIIHIEREAREKKMTDSVDVEEKMRGKGEKKKCGKHVLSSMMNSHTNAHIRLQTQPQTQSSVFLRPWPMLAAVWHVCGSAVCALR